MVSITGSPAADASVQQVLDETVRAAVGAGAVRAEVAGPAWPRLRDTFFASQAREALDYHRGLGHWPARAMRYGADVRSRLRRAESFTEANVAAAQRDVVAMRSEVRDLFDSVDVLVQLVAGSGPSLAASPDQVSVDGQVAELRDQVLPHTLLASVCGLPACSIPAGLDTDGLPVGVQVVGAPGQDELVLDVAEMLSTLT
jgi:Asp-tRNA(Asn)/Glu-tRNA(Gln) amidotransferase A subunit family amidase